MNTSTEASRAEWLAQPMNGDWEPIKPGDVEGHRCASEGHTSLACTHHSLYGPYHRRVVAPRAPYTCEKFVFDLLMGVSCLVSLAGWMSLLMAFYVDKLLQ